MKRILTSLLMITFLGSYSQTNIFTAGYTRTFVSKDSSSYGITLELNQTPGTTPGPGPTYFLNKDIAANEIGIERIYVKPTASVNLGTATASSPNNVAIGLPFGLAYDLTNPHKHGVISFYLEGNPEANVDKLFINGIYDLSVSPYLKYSIGDQSFYMIDLSVGAAIANGLRYELSYKKTDYYGRFTTPVYFKTQFWPCTFKGKTFKRFSLIVNAQYNHIYADDYIVSGVKDHIYCSVKFNFYLIPQLGLNIAYGYGSTEPLFKTNNALSIGLAIAMPS